MSDGLALFISEERASSLEPLSWAFSFEQKKSYFFLN